MKINGLHGSEKVEKAVRIGKEVRQTHSSNSRRSNFEAPEAEVDDEVLTAEEEEVSCTTEQGDKTPCILYSHNENAKGQVTDRCFFSRR